VINADVRRRMAMSRWCRVFIFLPFNELCSGGEGKKSPVLGSARTGPHLLKASEQKTHNSLQRH
jgi:hypothetical protein